MKSILLRLTGMCLIFAGLTSASVSAQSTITNTGPGSTNVITNSQSTSITSTCSNTTTVTNNNSQTAVSGTAVVSGNTSGGNATSGSASNSSTTNTAVSSNCGPVASLMTPAPGGGGGGGPVGGGGAVAAASTTRVSVGGSGIAMLPETGSDIAGKYLIPSVSLIGSLSAVAFGLINNYRRYLLKQL